MATIQKITTFLWFDTQAEEAATFYCSVFENSDLGRVTYYSSEGYEAHGKPAGSVMAVEFTIEGYAFTAINGGPHFKFSEAISFMVNCISQEEVDYFWEKLGQGGDPAAQQCGWLKDKFGVSWQIVPVLLGEMMSDANPDKVQRVSKVFFNMKKIDIEALQKAYDGDIEHELEQG